MKKLTLFFLLFLGIATMVLFLQKPLFATEKELSLYYFEKHQDEVCYLDLIKVGEDVINKNIIGRPPEKGSPEEFKDKKLSEKIAHHISDEDKYNALEVSNSIFTFSTVFGLQFNEKVLPKTAAFFQKVDEEISVAVEAAKSTFCYPRPLHNFGYSYPSGYSTRAYVETALLGSIFPDAKVSLKKCAKEQGKIRIILNKQYVSSINAGELYGKYLAEQFLKNPNFVKEWEEVKKEILVNVSASAGT